MIKGIWNKWKKVAEKIGDFEANVIFSLLFYIIITPIGLIVRLFRNNIFSESFPKWHKWLDSSNGLEKLRDQ